jgi:hypothetical protein
LMLLFNMRTFLRIADLAYQLYYRALTQISFEFVV